MTSLLANLDETIKTKNQEDKNTRYLAICEKYIKANDLVQAWVIVNQNATLVFFLNTNFQVGWTTVLSYDNTGYTEGGNCEK